jgi:hypothetical protein
MELTDKQIRLMRHTVSPKGRNWFLTDRGCLDSHVFEKLVCAGLATAEKAPEFTGDDVLYRLTPEGMDALNKRNVKA